MTDLDALERDLLASIAAAPDDATLEAARIHALGKKGIVSELLKGLGAMSPEARKEQGPRLNGLKDRVAAAIADRKAGLSEAELARRLEAERVDITLPARGVGVAPNAGRIHPVSQVTDEIVAIFADLGFAVAEGPDIESDDYNFTRLNIPPIIPRGRCMIPST